MHHGFRYKIAYALKEIGFKGNLYVIDVNKDVLEYVMEKYKMLIPEANIICVNKTFEAAFEDIPNEFDLHMYLVSVLLYISAPLSSIISIEQPQNPNIIIIAPNNKNVLNFVIFASCISVLPPERNL